MISLKELIIKILRKPWYEYIRLIYNPYIRSKFGSCGKNVYITWPIYTFNPHLINVGDWVIFYRRVRIEAFDHLAEYNSSKYKIEVGNGVSINWDCHIGAINKVKIGNGVLIGSKVLITDHQHGKINFEALKLPPEQRKLWSKGPVIIKDNVWIGEGVCVMPGVTIGENSIIGANSVVTKDIPANCVAAGVPAKVIKELRE